MTDSTKIQDRVYPLIRVVLPLAALYWAAFQIGSVFAVKGFSFSDSCWLLKLGQLITESHRIPSVDPFTFTLLNAKDNPPFVIYQWLSEILFFLCAKLFDLRGLILLCSSLVAVSFLVIPFRFGLSNRAPYLWLCATTLFVGIAATTRCTVRPEIISSFLLALLFLILSRLNKSESSAELENKGEHFDWPMVGLISLLMAVWSNCHPGFVIAAVILLLYTTCYALNDVFMKRKPSVATKTLALCTVSGIAATLLNPYGFGLWNYLPHLFFGAENAGVGELQPIGASTLVNKYAWVIGLIGLTCGKAICDMIHCHKDSGKWCPSWREPMHWLIMICAIILSFTSRRFVAVSALIILFESAAVRRSQNETRCRAPKIFAGKFSILLIELAICVFAWSGVVATSSAGTAITMPQANKQFTPPFQTLKVFLDKYKGGRVFSTAAVANMLDYYLVPGNAVFMDSRLDCYSERISKEFTTINSGHPGWSELLDSYKVDWIFVTPHSMLPKARDIDQKWQLLYKDDSGLVFNRRAVPPTATQ